MNDELKIEAESFELEGGTSRHGFDCDKSDWDSIGSPSMSSK